MQPDDGREIVLMRIQNPCITVQSSAGLHEWCRDGGAIELR